MAEVLSPPARYDGKSYYGGSPLKRSSPSQSSFLSAQYPGNSNATHPPSRNQDRPSKSLPSSTINSAHQSFSDLSRATSFSTPPSTISFASSTSHDDYLEDEEIAFPSYNDSVQFLHSDDPLDLSSSPNQLSDDEPQGLSSTTDSTRSDSPLPTPTVVDDTAVKQEPSRHVDYLSHDWREEDIWASWRHIVSQRRVYGQRSRLENASWRTWAKSKYQLSTISPESLNWLKESDVTWLYGPLQPAVTHPVTQRAEEPRRGIAHTGSFQAKKPILKKRSMSEVMLQRSISASSLVKQAAASVQAQQSLQTQRPMPHLFRAPSDFVTSTNASRPISRDQLDYFSSFSESDQESPSDQSKRHIRFDDKVEQCIAVDCKDNDPEDYQSDEEEGDDDDSDSDSSEDAVIMMRRPRPRPALSHRSSSQKPSTSTGKIIEKLPDTKLKDRTPSGAVVQQPPTPFARSWSSSKLCASASQETLRPVDPSRNFLLHEDDDGDDAEVDDWQPSGAFANRRDSVSVTRARQDDVGGEMSSGLRRTPSGMFMPYEEDEDDIVAEQLGLLGRVNDTINTAKDIAHVIWNVGWRK